MFWSAISGKHGLPEESHSSTAYIKLKQGVTFHEMCINNEHHYLIMEITYHPEPNLYNWNCSENILHVHEYPQQDNFQIRPSRLITKQEHNKCKNFLKGVPKIEKW